jgi:hypothetical protein
VPAAYGLARITGGDKGDFQLTGLAPGEYRVIALRSLDMNTGIQAFERALTNGQKVEVGPKGFQNVTLEVMDLQ